MSDKPKIRSWHADIDAPFPMASIRQMDYGQRRLTVGAYYVVERLNAVFGRYGTGWGIEITERREYEKHVAAFGSMWYVDPETSERGIAHAVGTGRIVGGNTPEAHKMACTNLISKASSYIGVALSVFKGLGVDDPHVAEAEEKERPTGKPNPDGSSNPVATDRDWQLVSQAREASGLSQQDVLAIMEGNPFCVDGEPRRLLAIHVPALIQRIETYREQP